MALQNIETHPSTF